MMMAAPISDIRQVFLAQTEPQSLAQSLVDVVHRRLVSSIHHTPPSPMPSIKGFTCSLTIEGHDDPAIEHGKKQEGSDYVSAYVIAEGRKRFSLTVSGEEYIHPALDVAVWIDGKYQDGRIMDSLSEKKFEFHEKFTGKEEKHGRKIVKRLWKFGELNVGGLPPASAAIDRSERR